MIDGLRGAVSFLTPIGGAAAPTATSVRWFPVVGAATGLAVGGVWWTAHEVWPAAVAAALAVIADLAFTGLLHVDGLCDAADALLGPMAAERRLQVMAEPDVGAFGIAASVSVLLLRWAALAALHPTAVLAAAVWTASRAGMAVTLVTVPYARPGGLATAFRGGGRAAPIAGVVGAVLLAALWRPLAGPAAVAGVGLGMSLVVLLAWRRLRGFTGDVLGAAGVVGETVGLVVASARW